LRTIEIINDEIRRGSTMLDKFDIDIILALIKNGRESYMDIARSMRVNEAAIRKRINQLLKEELISVSAFPDLRRLGFDFMALVGLQVRLADIKGVGAKLAEQPNIVFVSNVTGQYEFLIVVVAKNSRDFAGFMETIISEIPGIIRTETSVVLNNYKGKQAGFDTTKLISKLEFSSKKKVRHVQP
jgi:Lrp/AsnC family transcriptional regulator, regulator for asnA, asnC and gidA